MGKQGPIPKSLTEQIFDTMFLILGNQDEFDDKVIQELKRLAEHGGLTRTRIINAIKLSPEEMS